MKRTLYLFLMLTVLLLTGCRKQSPVADKLQQAEAMMDEHPDSALNLLKGIAQPELQTQAHHARYALLYSQALDKNYIDLTNDSLISIAVGLLPPYRRCAPKVPFLLLQRQNP